MFRTRAKQMLLIFGIAFALRLAMCVWGADRVPPTADGAFYHVVAQRIAQGQGYTWLWPDGTVTFAAHYPVGYPAMMSVVYYLFGAVPLWAMLGNAFMGASGVTAAYWLSASALEKSRIKVHTQRSAFISALALALSPTLILYTPALMTEAVVGALLAIAICLAIVYQSEDTLRHTRVLLFVGLALVLAISCLVRPQSLIMAALLGLLLEKGIIRRLLSCVSLIVLTLAMVSPWTLRNCDRMDSCVFVSANGGWNLLIGSYPEGNGAWVGIEGERVPEECRTIFSESGKDKCFSNAGRQRIMSAPLAWLKLVPAKLRATFDYSAAGVEHLYAAGAVNEAQKTPLQILEYAWQRAFAILTLVGAWFAASARRGNFWPTLGLVFGVISFLGAGAWLGWLIVVCLLLAVPRVHANLPLVAAAGSIASTAAIHAVFFGAGRYSLPIWYVAAPVAAIGIATLNQARDRLRQRFLSN